MSDYVCGIVDEMWARDTNNGQFWNIKVDGQSFGFGKYPPKFSEGSEVEFDIKWNGEYANVDWDTFNVLNQVGDGPRQQRQGGGRQGGGGGQRQGGGGGQRQSQGGSGGGGYNRGQGGGGGSRQGGTSGRSSGGSGQQRQQSRPQQQQRSQGGGGGGLSKDDYWSRKEERDLVVQQNIQFQASRNAAIAALDSMLKVEAVKLPAKQADKYDAYLELLDTLTERFNGQTSDQGKEQRGGGGRNNQQDDDNQQYDDDNMPAYEPGDE